MTNDSETSEITEETVQLATIAWYEATPGVSWADAGKYERAAMLSRSKLILEAALPHLRAQETRVNVRMKRPEAPDWGGEETDEGTNIYNSAWDSDDGELRLWVGPYSGGLNEGWAVSLSGAGLDVVLRCTADEAVEWTGMVAAAVRDSRREAGAEKVHLIADDQAVTSCCGKTPFDLPRDERITVDSSEAYGCARGPRPVVGGN